MNNITKIEITPKIEDSIDVFIDEFISSQDVKASSKDTYGKALKQFALWVSEIELNNPTRIDILAYKEYLNNKGLSSLTMSSYLVAVRKFFEWTECMKLYPNVAKGIKGARKSNNIKKDCLTIVDIKRLLDHINSPDIKGKRDYAMVNLLIRTGLRTIELIRANIGDIRQQSGETVLWVQGKGRDSKDEFVLLTEDALRPIRDYLNGRSNVEDNKPLFASLSDRNAGNRLTTRSIRRIVKNNLRGIGLNSNKLTAHSLRHTAITLALKGGATIQEAQALGRHANINTTLIYSHNINRVVNAAEKKIDGMLEEIK